MSTGLNACDLQRFERVWHHLRDAIVSSNTSDISLNNIERIDGILA